MLLPVQACGIGVNLDLLPSELPAGVWSDASNVRFRNGFAARRAGFEAAYTTPTAVPYWLGTFSTPTNRFLIQLGTATAFVDDGTTRTEITGTPPTGARDDRWSGFDFNGVFVCNNGADDPMYWNGDTGTNLAAITGWTAGTKADALAPFGNYIFAIAPTISGTKYPYRVMWGNAAEPGALPSTWTAAATNDAGDKDLIGVGRLLDAMQLGSTLILYGEEGRIAVNYIGGAPVFSFQTLPGKDGLLYRGCVANTPRGHVFLTGGDVRLHAGGESISIADGMVREYLSSSIDNTNARRAFVVLNQQEAEVWVAFPSSGMDDCNTVLAWNLNAKPGEGWAKFTVPNLTHATCGLVSSNLGATTWAELSGTWAELTNAWSQFEAATNESKLVVVTSTPVIGLANATQLDFGERVNWYVEKRGIPLSDVGSLNRSIRSVWPKLKANSGTAITVKLATTKGPDQQPTFSTESTFTVDTNEEVPQFTQSGRYGAIRFEGADDNQVAMRSYVLDVTEGGSKY